MKCYLLSKKKISFFTRLKLKLKYKVKAEIITDKNQFIDYLDSQYYTVKLKQLADKIEEIQKYLAENNLEELNNQLQSLSVSAFKNFLFSKYSKIPEESFTADNYRQKYTSFINRYPVVLSTTHSLLRNCPDDFQYDLVIMDEGSQSDILTSLLTMNIAKKMVVVGDQKQLPQIDNTDLYPAADELAAKISLPTYFQYRENSLLSSLISMGNIFPMTTLVEHYRCDARIIEFNNRKFYNNELVICTKTSTTDPLFVIHTVKGHHARKNPKGSGIYNDREAQEILELLKTIDEQDVGIITPFRAQADYLSRLISSKYPNVEVDTVHKFQGRQKKIIILSTVINDISEDDPNRLTDFVTNPNLLNVAISRAISKLYIVVSDGVYESQHNLISQFVSYIKYYCGESNLKEGRVVSIFDDLYNDNYQAVTQSPLFRYVDSEAETIMLDHLNSLLKDYPDLKIQMHVTLSSLLTNYQGFTDSEIKYITNRLTHVDFVLFDKINYKPVLCIEVDGTKYHDYSQRQIEHDRIKTRVLEANGLKILRLKTNAAGEMEKIRNCLN
ncbi:MAG: AAA domain-containing protein [Bacilli bacterium]